VTEVSFYHLQRQSLEEALPALLERVMGAGLRALVRAGSEARIDSLNTALWCYDAGAFLPHGTVREGAPEEQPVLLSADDDGNPNGATVLVQVDGVRSTDIEAFERCLDLFDGRDEEAVAAARARWKKCTESGHTVTYWQQTDAGRWEKKN